MKKSISSIIDELTVTNIKIFYLVEKIEKGKQSFSKNRHALEDAKKLRDLKEYHSQLRNALNSSKAMKKSISSIIDELTVTNIKIFILVDKIKKNKHTKKDAKKAQDLNTYRGKLMNAINAFFNEYQNIKI